MKRIINTALLVAILLALTTTCTSAQQLSGEQSLNYLFTNMWEVHLGQKIVPGDFYGTVNHVCSGTHLWWFGKNSGSFILAEASYPMTWEIVRIEEAMADIACGAGCVTGATHTLDKCGIVNGNQIALSYTDSAGGAIYFNCTLQVYTLQEIRGQYTQTTVYFDPMGNRQEIPTTGQITLTRVNPVRIPKIKQILNL